MHAIDYASQARDIFVLPDAVIQIKRLIDDSSSNMEDIARVISFDPALTIQILKIANSALYKFPNKIDSVTKAIQVIGTNSVYDLVIACSICRTFGEINPNIIDLEQYWENSVYCALLSKYFAEKQGCKEPERLFVSGLLHNIGELIMVQFNPVVAQKCAQFDERNTPLDLQLKHLGATYAEIGASLTQMWGIPSTITSPMKNLHFSLSEPTCTDDKIIQLSYILALDNTHPEFYGGNANLEIEMYERLGLTTSDLNAALSHVGMQSLSVLAMFSPNAVTVI